MAVISIEIMEDESDVILDVLAGRDHITCERVAERIIRETVIAVDKEE